MESGEQEKRQKKRQDNYNKIWTLLSLAKRKKKIKDILFSLPDADHRDLRDSFIHSVIRIQDRI